MGTVFISHSSRDDAAAAQLRRRLSEVLSTPGLGHEVWLDEEAIIGGDVWRPKLHRWLALCNTAILLLTPPALQSEWVRTEVTILTWRRSLGSRVVVIPVFIGVTRADIDAAFGSLQISESQPVRLGVEEIADVDAAVDAIVARVATMPCGSDALQEWADRLEGRLDTVFLADRVRVARSLGLGDAPPWIALPEAAGIFAQALLNTERLLLIRNALLPIVSDNPSALKLVKLVSPVGVPAEAAVGLLAICQRPGGRRLVLLPVRKESTAQRYVQRAACVNELWKVNGPPGIATGGGVDEILLTIVRTLAVKTLGADDGESDEDQRAFVDRRLRAMDDTDGGRVVQLIQVSTGPGDDGLTRDNVREVVTRLLDQLPRLVVMILARPPLPAGFGLDIPGLDVVLSGPPDPDSEVDDNSYIKELTNATGVRT